MWLVFTFSFAFFLSIVNYIDEYLTAHNALPESSDLHTKIGGLLLISSLFSVGGATVAYLLSDNVWIAILPLMFALLSAVPQIIMWTGYFYLLNTYPVYQVIPLFGMGTLWLLILELLNGGSITFIALSGVIVLVVSAYVLDSGTLKWQIPTSLLPYMVIVSLCSALSHFFVRIASAHGALPAAITFWQFSGIVCIGIMFFLFVKKYRDGFLFRIRNQGKQFVGLSLINEGSSQIAYYSGITAVTLAPLATYVSALGGLQSMLLLGIFYVFPQKPITINKLQVGAIFMMAAGVFLLEGWKYL